MRKSLPIVANLLVLFLSSCDINNDRFVRSDLQLTSPNGVRIAKSVAEIEQIAHLLMEDKHGVGTVITITKVDYKKLRPSPRNSFAATIHYKTATGQQDEFDFYGGRPLIAN